MTEQHTPILRTDQPIRFEIEQIDVRSVYGPPEFVPGRPSWAIAPIEFDTPEKARQLVGKHLVLDVEGDGLFHAIGEHADGARLSVLVTGPVEEPPITRSSAGS